MNHSFRPHVRILIIAFAAYFINGCVQPPGSPDYPLPSITASDEQLLANGQPFEVRGVNYVRSSGVDPNTCWTLQFGADARCPWDLPAITADFDKLRALGINTIRVFLNFYVFGGSVPVIGESGKGIALRHLEDLIHEANQRGIYVILVLLIEYPQDQFASVHYERAFDVHVRPIVRNFAGNDGILAWDLFNEPDIGSPVDIRCWDWDNADHPGCFPLAEERQQFIAALSAEVAMLDPGRLRTTGLAFAKSHFEPIEAAARIADMVDFFTFHYYDDGPYHSGRYEAHWYYGKGFPDDLRRSIEEIQALGLKRPIVVTELGFPTVPLDPEASRDDAALNRDLRAARDLLREVGAGGMVLWSFQDSFTTLLDDLYPPR